MNELATRAASSWYCADNESPAISIVKEEAAAFFAGDKSAEDVAKIVQNRVSIYLAEQQ